MSWKVAGEVDGEARVIESAHGQLAGDPATLAEITGLLDDGAGVMETPTGPLARTHGVGDERGAYLWALALLDRPVVSGNPPPGPARPAADEADFDDIAF